MNKLYLDWNAIELHCNKLAFQILKSDWKPDYIVGIGSSGLVPAVIISHILEVPMHSLKVSLSAGQEEDCDHNCWMSEDAFGYEMDNPANILIIDNINDPDTIAWIKKDWTSSCLPDRERWNDVWANNVRFASIVNNLASTETVTYSSLEINQAEDDVLVVFPWEK
jgi:hypothetical protein